MEESKVESEVKTEKPQFIENQLLGHKLTPEGYKEIRWKSGVEVIVEPQDELVDFPRKFKESNRKAFNAICFAISESVQNKRVMPLFREELINNLKIKKQDIKDLEQIGVMETHLIPVTTKEGKNLGGRLVVVPTSQGRALKKIMEAVLAEELEKISDVVL